MHTSLEDNMKAIVAVLLLSAFAAYASAEEQTFNKAVFQFLDERHDEKMVQVLRDNGLPEDNWIASDHPEPADVDKPCFVQGKLCWEQAGHDACKKLACIDNFYKCLYPTPPPSMKPLEKGCLALFFLCRKNSPTCAGELCCYVRIKRCFEFIENVKE